MIINIRGTSGSGKSTLARSIMEHYGGKSLVKKKGRRQPLMYVFNPIGGGRKLAVIGHYETPCGGCDTISSMDEIFSLVRSAHTAGHDVLFEGLLISAEVNRTAALQEEGLPLKVVALDVPLDVCLDSINERRRRKNPDAPDVPSKNTESKHRGVKKSVERLLQAGVDVQFYSREEALKVIKGVLDL